MITEQCFSELIKSTLNLPPLRNRENQPFVNDPFRLLECSNSENNNANSVYSDSGKCLKFFLNFQCFRIFHANIFKGFFK